MKTSIATVTMSGELDDKLRAIAKAGFDGVEIFENDFLAFDSSPRDVGRMVRDHGLEITLFQPFRDFEGMPEPQRSRTFDRAERKFDVMQELGTDLVLVCSNVSPVSLGGLDRAAADFHRTRRARGKARPEGRLRGACLGPAYQRSPRCLGDRPPRRSSQCRPDPRQLPHARRARSTSIRSARSRRKRSSSSSLPMRR